MNELLLTYHSIHTPSPRIAWQHLRVTIIPPKHKPGRSKAGSTSQLQITLRFANAARTGAADNKASPALERFIAPSRGREHIFCLHSHTILTLSLAVSAIFLG